MTINEFMPTKKAYRCPCDMRPLKKTMRQTSVGLRDAIPAEVRIPACVRITDAVTSLDVWRSARTVLCYVSVRSETDTADILSRAFDEGKRVALPRCGSKRGEMSFIYVSRGEALTESRFGIPEPTGSDEFSPEGADSFICIVPALAFDEMGYRIGYGGGYYDRYLPRLGCKNTVGICFDCQMTPDPLPHGRFDRHVDIIVTEKQVLYINKGGKYGRK